MKNIIDSIRLQINERLNSPLSGSFVLAWVCWNHRFLVVLFSALPVDKKFEFVDSNIFVTNWGIWLHCLIGPLLTAILFIYLYPVISKHFYAYWLRQQLKLKVLRDNIEGATLLTREESHAIRLEIIKTREEYEETIHRQAAEIEALKKNSTNTDQVKNREDQLQLRKQLEEVMARQSNETENLKAQLHDILKRQHEVPISAEQEQKRQQEFILQQKKLDDIMDRQQHEMEALRAQLSEVMRRQSDDSTKPSDKTRTVEKGTLTLIELLTKNGGRLNQTFVLQEFSKQFKDSNVRVQYYVDEAVRLNLIRMQYRNNTLYYELTEEGRRLAVQLKYA